MKSLFHKPIRLFFICNAAIVCAALFAGVVYVSLDGPDTLVINDTDRQVTLNNCGDSASSIPPGDVTILKPGSKAYIPSAKYQKGNVCDIAIGTDDGPDACLPLPPHGGGSVKVREGLRPYPRNSNDLCDVYIKF